MTSASITERRAPRQRLRALVVSSAAVLSLLAALVAAPTASADFGFQPGSVFTKFHEPAVQPDPFYVGPRLGLVFDVDAWIQGIKDAPEVTQAGAHPDFSTSFKLNGNGIQPDGDMKDLIVDTPAGFVGDPGTVERCTPADFYLTDLGNCAPGAQVGDAVTVTEIAPIHSQVFNLVPPPGVPALFGFKALNIAVLMTPSVRSDGDYGLRVSVLDAESMVGLNGSTVTLWGTPYDHAHDAHRIGADGFLGGSILGTPKPFMTTPTYCNSGPLATTFKARSWGDQGTWVEETVPAPEPTGCDKLKFGGPGAEVGLTAQPTSTKANSPTGLDVELSIPYQDDPDLLATPSLRNVKVSLPQGMAINPAAADGLASCSEAEIGLHSLAEPACPNASKLGTVEIDTPLLDKPMKGFAYQATQNQNPFNSTFALYVAAQGPGVQIKLAGKIEADPVTGQLTTTFDDNPQLPFTNLHLKLFGGPRAAVVTPKQCGTYTTTSDLTPWSAPWTAVATSSDSFDISGDGQGGPCAAAQFNPTLHAGLTNPVAGSSSTFVLRLQRDDIDNEFKTISTTMPPGLLAKVAGVPLCSDGQAAAGSCPADSQIGRVEVGAGAGSNPFYITNGKVYLTEGYKGGPFGLAISVPAVAGPFDLGTVNVRAALQIDPLTAQVTVVSDPMPQILEGIPLQVRDVRVIVDRPGFMQSPTNCNEMSIGATVGSYSGDSASVSNRFEVGECAGLAFAPKIAMAFTNRSQVHKRKKPGLDFRLSQKPGESNIKSVTVKLPRALVLDVNGASGALCEVAQAENGTCPASSIVGHASAVTPLLDQPLAGAVYFVRGDNALPNIMVALRGAININLRSKSKVDKMGRLISTFDTVPDAPISQFHLILGSAGRGVLSVAPDSDLCTGPNSKGKASIAIEGQNGKRESLSLKIKTPCKKAHKRSRKGGR